MRKTTRDTLATPGINEKDVEHAYWEEIKHHRPKAVITSPYGTDGYAQWGNVRLLCEVKADEDLQNPKVVCKVVGQLVIYLKKFEDAADLLPNVLLVADKDECIVIPTRDVAFALRLTTVDWDMAASKGCRTLEKALLDHGIGNVGLVQRVAALDFAELLSRCETYAAGEEPRIRASTANLFGIYQYWKSDVIKDQDLTPVEYVDVFLRHLIDPSVPLHPKKAGVLMVPAYDEGVLVDPKKLMAYEKHFERGYTAAETASFYAMKDQLVEDDPRRRQGAFFTPPIWVREAHLEVDKVLGPNWKNECIVWDPCCGTGNLTRGYSFANLILSTGERPDVSTIKQEGYNQGADVFQLDFLNIGTDSPFEGLEGRNVIPSHVEEKLRAAAKAGKRIVFFMNPPYAEGGVAGANEKSRRGVALTTTNKEMAKLGRANRQLYTQFMWRAAEIALRFGFEKYTIGVFCKTVFMSTNSYQPFRDWWFNRHSFESGFMFQASHFADVSDAWGIAFTMWSFPGKTAKNTCLRVTLKDEVNLRVVSTGTKAIYNSDGCEATKWVFDANPGMSMPSPLLTSGLRVYPKAETYVERWCRGALFQMANKGNSLMTSATDVFLLSAKTSQGSGRPVLPSNWRRAVALYGARKLVKGDWINDKDEYLRPDEKAAGYEQWVDDAHVYALLHNSNNCTAMRDVVYQATSWRIKNHWFWRTRKDTTDAMGAILDSRRLLRDVEAEPIKDDEDIFGLTKVEPWEETGDPYFAHLLATGLRYRLSPDTRKVLDLLDDLWVKSLPDREHYARSKPELHLLAWDAGIYQLKHLWRDLFPTEWKALQEASKALSLRLQPGVYDYGFLKNPAVMFDAGGPPVDMVPPPATMTEAQIADLAECEEWLNSLS